MKITCASSGSESGNCYALQSDDGHYILLDCGVSYKVIERACNYETGKIDFALCSHVHEDHAYGIPKLIGSGIAVYSNSEVYAKYQGTKILSPNKVFSEAKWKVIPFSVPHTHNTGEPCENYAYIIFMDGQKLLYLTDWMYCKYDLSRYNINHFLIAVNYTDLEDDNQGKIGHVVRGHSSLETVKEFLRTSMTDSCKNILACHLSNRNADADQILTELTELAPTSNVAIMKKGTTYTL